MLPDGYEVAMPNIHLSKQHSFGHNYQFGVLMLKNLQVLSGLLLITNYTTATCSATVA